MLKEGWYSRAEAGLKHIAARGNTKHRGRRSSGQRCYRGVKRRESKREEERS